jgi:hypothetical protein
MDSADQVRELLLKEYVEAGEAARQHEQLTRTSVSVFLPTVLSLAASLGLPRLAHLLLPTGRTMRDIDIIGITTDAKRLRAQVTFSPLENCAWKIDRLLSCRGAKDTHLLLFCDCAEPVEQNGVRIFPIQRAYDIFISTPHGKQWLRRSA